MDSTKSNIEYLPKRSIADAAEFLGISAQATHKQLKMKGITCHKIGNKSFITFDTARKLFNFNFKKKKLQFKL